MYIGKEPIVGNFQKCDAITVVNGQAAYTLQVSSTNVVPESANHMLVSLNGILQAPVTSFSVSGSTLTFVSNLATGDVIDFVILLGNVLDLGTPSDGTVTNAKLAQDIISGETELAVAPASTDEFLVSDAGTLKRVDASLVGRGKVLQVVSATYGTQESSSSTSFVASSLTASITPASTSNKVLIMVSGTQTTSNNLSHCVTTIYRDGTTNLGDSSYGISYAYSAGGSTHSGISMNYLDSPSTTSSTEYKMYYKATAAHASFIQNGGALSTIILMEIAG